MMTDHQRVSKSKDNNSHLSDDDGQSQEKQRFVMPLVGFIEVS